MTFLRKLEAEPWRFDYFTVLRFLERTNADRPRIGDSAALRDEFVAFGQDPYMDFPASNLARVEHNEGKPLKVLVKYLGLARAPRRPPARDDGGSLSLPARPR